MIVSLRASQGGARGKSESQTSRSFALWPTNTPTESCRILPDFVTARSDDASGRQHTVDHL